MADEQRDKFIERLNRIGQAHSEGKAFAAPGTVGRLPVQKKRRGLHISLLRAVAIAILGIMAMKIAIYGIGGASEYDQRLEALGAQGVAGQTLSWLFQPDPLTRLLGGLIASLMP